MCHTAYCIVEGPASSEAIFAELGRAGFTDAEISIASTTPPHPAGSQRAAPHHPPEALPSWCVRRSLIAGATLGLIAGLGGLAIDAEGRRQRADDALATRDVPAAIDASRSPDDSDASRERVRTLAYHFSLGRDLIAVRTANYYEIETILEIFRAGGALFHGHLVDRGDPEGQQPAPAAAAAVPSHAAIQGDRMRASA
jgi:hypothetical protein